MTLRLDSHQHFWRFNPVEYGWIDDSMSTLRRDFLPEDLAPLAAAQQIDGAVAVQARQTLEETDWLLALAQQHPSLVRGVVGWAPIASKGFPHILRRLCSNSTLRGLRHIVQAEPDGFLLQPNFQRGIAALRDTGLVYDILITARQLPEAITFVDMHPQQAFVLDHIAKPDLRTLALEPWAAQIRDLARRPNVYCKLSGMVTEADWHNWTPTQIQPFYETVLEAFTPQRLMAGSDWPVCTVAASYERWWQTARSWIASLSETEQADILGVTAASVYKITPVS